METVTISKEEYFHLKEDIREIKENYVSKSEIESLLLQNQIYFDVALKIDKQVRDKKVKLLGEDEVL